MSSDGSSMSQWKPHPPLTRCYQTIRTRPLLSTLEKTSAVSLHSDTSASHTLPPQQAWEPGGQKQHAKDWNCSHCEFQSVTSVVCFSSLLGVWYSFEVWLALVKENWGVSKQLAAGGGVEWVGCRGDMVVVVVGGCCSLTAIIVSGIYRIGRRLYWALIRFKPLNWSCFIHSADGSLAQMTMQNICKTQHWLKSKTPVLYDDTSSTLTT